VLTPLRLHRELYRSRDAPATEEGRSPVPISPSGLHVAGACPLRSSCSGSLDIGGSATPPAAACQSAAVASRFGGAAGLRRVACSVAERKESIPSLPVGSETHRVVGLQPRVRTRGTDRGRSETPEEWQRGAQQSICCSMGSDSTLGVCIAAGAGKYVAPWSSAILGDEATPGPHLGL